MAKKKRCWDILCRRRSALELVFWRNRASDCRLCPKEYVVDVTSVYDSCSTKFAAFLTCAPHVLQRVQTYQGHSSHE